MLVEETPKDTFISRYVPGRSCIITASMISQRQFLDDLHERVSATIEFIKSVSSFIGGA